MSALESAKRKLTDVIAFENLPQDRNDNLWSTIRTECGLSLDELSALKNAVSPPDQNLKDLIVEIKKSLYPIATMVCNLAIESNNLWTNTQKTDVITKVETDQKDRFLAHLGYLQEKSGKKRKRLVVQCMVSGEEGNSDSEVIMAHIVPKKAKLKLLASIGMKEQDVQNIRNCFLLAKGIEEAFDRLQLSFIKSNPLLDRLYVKIWDDSIRATPIFEGSRRTIGEFDNARLKLANHNPFRRALSYQAYLAFLKFQHLNPDHSQPDDYGSVHESDIPKMRQLMKQTVVTTIEREISEERET